MYFPRKFHQGLEGSSFLENQPLFIENICKWFFNHVLNPFPAKIYIPLKNIYKLSFLHKVLQQFSL